jgi:hypothetical protein
VTDDIRMFGSIALEEIVALALSLGVDVAGLSQHALVRAILGVPGGDRMLVSADPSIPRILDALYGGVARQGGYIDHGSMWIAFDADDAYIEAEIKTDAQQSLVVVCIDAYLLESDNKGSSETEVSSWIAQQPTPVLGTLSTGSRQTVDSAVEYLPLLSVQIHPDGLASEFVKELLSPFADAWNTRSVATGTEHLEFGSGGGPYRVRNEVEIEPQDNERPTGDGRSARFHARSTLSAVKEAAERQGSSLDVFIVALPVWDQREVVRGLEAQVVVLLAPNADSPAVYALPIIDIPIYREMADRFLHGEACRTVAEIDLGGQLWDAHSAMTIFGGEMPGGRADLVAMLGSRYGYAPAPEPAALLPTRRVARRG